MESDRKSNGGVTATATPPEKSEKPDKSEKPAPPAPPPAQSISLSAMKEMSFSALT